MHQPTEIDPSVPKNGNLANLSTQILADVRHLAELELKLLQANGKKELHKVERRILIAVLAFALLLPAAYQLGEGLVGMVEATGILPGWATRLLVTLILASPFAWLIFKNRAEVNGNE